MIFLLKRCINALSLVLGISSLEYQLKDWRSWRKNTGWQFIAQRNAKVCPWRDCKLDSETSIKHLRRNHCYSQLSGSYPNKSMIFVKIAWGNHVFQEFSFLTSFSKVKVFFWTSFPLSITSVISTFPSSFSFSYRFTETNFPSFL